MKYPVGQEVIGDLLDSEEMNCGEEKDTKDKAPWFVLRRFGVAYNAQK